MTESRSDKQARRNALLAQLAAALAAYDDLVTDHEQEMIAGAEFRRAGPDAHGKSALLDLTLRCYADGRVFLELHDHAPDAPSGEPYHGQYSVENVVGAIRLLCRRAIARAQTYSEPEGAQP